MAVTALGGNGMVSIAQRRRDRRARRARRRLLPAGRWRRLPPDQAAAALRLAHATRPVRWLPGRSARVTLPTLSGIPATSMSGALLNVTALAASGRRSVDRAVRRPATARPRPCQLRPRPAGAEPRRGQARGRHADPTGRDATAHVVVDVVGWWAPQAVVGGRLFQPQGRDPGARHPDRARRPAAARVGPGGVLTVQVAGKGKPVPGSARAVVLNVTSIGATRNTTVTAWPNGARRPTFPDLTVRAWRPTSNLVVIKVGAKNRVRVANADGVDAPGRRRGGLLPLGWLAR